MRDSLSFQFHSTGGRREEDERYLSDENASRKKVERQLSSRGHFWLNFQGERNFAQMLAPNESLNIRLDMKTPFAHRPRHGRITLPL